MTLKRLYCVRCNTALAWFPDAGRIQQMLYLLRCTNEECSAFNKIQDTIPVERLEILFGIPSPS